MNEFPFVSVIVPCRNEESFIGRCLDTIIANDYPKQRLEVLVVDGLSQDNTINVVEKYTQKYFFIRLLHNEKMIVPSALNLGILNARGEIIIRMDAHATYEKDYISKCVLYLNKYDVDNVGGICITLPINNDLMGQSIALALSHPFGVGNAYFRTGSKEPKYVDTVPFGCYKKEVFERIGLFEENLIRNQDIEFNLRLKKGGGKILLVPDVISYYLARSNFKDLFKQNFLNGFWVIYGCKFANVPFSIRHLVPFVFVSSLLSSLISSLMYNSLVYLFIPIICIYTITNLFFSLVVAIKTGLKLFPFLVLSFFILHFSYGIGSIWGVIKLAISGFKV